jgi:hypothetical protein
MGSDRPRRTAHAPHNFTALSASRTVGQMAHCGTMAETERSRSAMRRAALRTATGGGSQLIGSMARHCLRLHDHVDGARRLQAAGLAAHRPDQQRSDTHRHHRSLSRSPPRPPFLCLPLPAQCPSSLPLHRHASPISAHRMRVRAAGAGRRSVQRVQVQRLDPVRIRGLRLQVSDEPAPKLHLHCQCHRRPLLSLRSQLLHL